MNKDTDFSTDCIDITPNSLQLLEDYVGSIGAHQQKLLNDVNTYIHSGQITTKTLMDAITWMSFLKEDNESGQDTQKKSFREIAITFSKFIPLIAEIFQAHSRQIELLEGVQKFCCSEAAKSLPIFPKLIKCFYDFEILTSDAIMEWYESELTKQNITKAMESSDPSDMNAAILRELRPFVAWLESPPEDVDEDD